MRKFMVIAMAGLLALAVAGPVAAAPSVSNLSGTIATAYGEWYDGDTYGSFWAFEENGSYGSYGDVYLFEVTGTWVECAATSTKGKGGPSTHDTAPGDFGFVGTRIEGYGSDIDLTFDRKMSKGVLTGHIEAYQIAVDDCAGTYDVVAEASAELNVALPMVGPVVSRRGLESIKVPSDFNAHRTVRGTERQLAGAIDFGLDDIGLGSRDIEYGYAASFGWTEHANS